MNDLPDTWQVFNVISSPSVRRGLNSSDGSFSHSKRRKFHSCSEWNSCFMSSVMEPCPGCSLTQAFGINKVISHPLPVTAEMGYNVISKSLPLSSLKTQHCVILIPTDISESTTCIPPKG